MSVDPRAASGFASVADAYDRGRPSYPAEAIDRIVAGLRLTGAAGVLDLAAGTGQLSRLLRTRVRRTIAVEPVPAMRAKIAAVLPDVAVLDGTAEAIPLRDRERRRVAGRVRAHPPVRRPRARRAHARPEARSGRLRGTGRLVELDREPPERAAQDVLEEVHALVQGHDAIVIPYRTDLYVARRRAS